ncbi:MAG: hypothetical protein AAGA37_19855 [Actinomycetota bacterium]
MSSQDLTSVFGEHGPKLPHEVDLDWLCSVLNRQAEGLEAIAASVPNAASTKSDMNRLAGSLRRFRREWGWLWDLPRSTDAD